MTFTVGGRGGHLQVLLLVAALWNAGAQGLAEVEAEAGSGRKRVAGRRVLPQLRRQTCSRQRRSTGRRDFGADLAIWRANGARGLERADGSW